MSQEIIISLLQLFFTAAVVENIVLYYFLGTCPVISISDDLTASFQMGMAVTFVMVLTASINLLIYNHLLVPLGLEYLYLLFFMLTIAAVTQVLEQAIDSLFPKIYAAFGIFLSLLVVNCAILGVALFAMLREYSLLSTAVYALGSGLGWTGVICLIASLKRRIRLDLVPASVGKLGITMLVAAVVAMAFGGLSEVLGGGILWP